MKELNKIVVLPGDGIGPEVVAQGVKVLEAVMRKFDLSIEMREGLIGSIAIDETGAPFPAETQKMCEEADAILLGAIGHPKYDNDPTLRVRPEQGLLKMRKELGLYANIRPIRLFPSLAELSVIKEPVLAGTDFVIYRELTGGIYFGKKSRTADYAVDECSYHRYEIERIARLAFEEAMKRKKELCLIDKANVLDSSRLWREVVGEIGKLYPEVTISYLFVDNAAMQIVLNPSQFDVVLCSNLFGDIISDEASVLVGSLGLLPSSSKGEGAYLYEPIHGSYPQAAGKDIANPIATILSVEMMLRDFGQMEAADAIQRAVDYCIVNEIWTEDLGGNKKCSEVGDAVVEYLGAK